MNEEPNSGKCLNPWKQPLAYLALFSGVLGAVVTTIPIFPIFSLLLAAFPMLVASALGVHVQIRTSGASNNSERMVVFGLSIIPLLLLLLIAVFAANGTANSLFALAHGRQPNTMMVVQTLLSAVIPAAILIAIAVMKKKVSKEEAWMQGVYWLSFPLGAALAAYCFRV